MAAPAAQPHWAPMPRPASPQGAPYPQIRSATLSLMLSRNIVASYPTHRTDRPVLNVPPTANSYFARRLAHRALGPATSRFPYQAAPPPVTPRCTIAAPASLLFRLPLPPAATCSQCRLPIHRQPHAHDKAPHPLRAQLLRLLDLQVHALADERDLAVPAAANGGRWGQEGEAGQSRGSRAENGPAMRQGQGCVWMAVRKRAFFRTVPARFGRRRTRRWRPSGR